MIRRPARRRPAARGFVLAEALVALSVAALTLALMTSATFGLRQTAFDPPVVQQSATDWLTVRRVLQAWAGSATANGVAGLPSRFFGAPDQMRLVLDDGTSRDNRPVTVTLDISQEDGLFTLTGTRHTGVRDVRLIGDEGQTSTMIISDSPLILSYYVVGRGNAAQRVWTYEPRPEQGLPAAIAVEQGDTRMVIAQMPATRSMACIARLGEPGLGETDCELR
ncbi:MAG: hypothetical protein AAFU41_19310 [Pseudomonadota bacterium]